METRPIVAGSLLALAAALSFGVTTPLIARAGHGVGALTTAALLYIGACAASGLLSLVSPRAGVSPRAHIGRVMLIALAGAGVAPSLLAWGLQRVGGTAGSLLLNLETVFTIALASVIFRERFGARVAIAMTLMVTGGLAAALHGGKSLSFGGLGAAAIAGATFAWAIDNTLTRGLTDVDPLQLVACKGALGAFVTLIGAVSLREPWPSASSAILLVACGATGYGLSLRLYLLAQRRVGASRTASLFSIAPFVGATLGWFVSDDRVDGWTALSAVLFAAGVVLHLGESEAPR
jgi:drug/metabolite transporter (DMT)-like permease